MIRNAIVPVDRNAPVIEKSSWVTPCCTRSPMITSRTSSNGGQLRQLAAAHDAQQHPEHQVDGEGPDHDLHQGHTHVV